MSTGSQPKEQIAACPLCVLPRKPQRPIPATLNTPPDEPPRHPYPTFSYRYVKRSTEIARKCPSRAVVGRVRSHMPARPGKHKHGTDGQRPEGTSHHLTLRTGLGGGADRPEGAYCGQPWAGINPRLALKRETYKRLDRDRASGYVKKLAGVRQACFGVLVGAGLRSCHRSPASFSSSSDAISAPLTLIASERNSATIGRPSAMMLPILPAAASAILALLPVHRSMLSVRSSSCCRHRGSSSDTASSLTTNRSISLCVPPSPRAVEPKTETWAAAISQAPTNSRIRPSSSTRMPARISTAGAARCSRFKVNSSARPASWRSTSPCSTSRLRTSATPR
jgi:hypothetical protein